MLSTRLPIRQIERAANPTNSHVPPAPGLTALCAPDRQTELALRVLSRRCMGKFLTVSYRKYYFVSVYRLSGSINFAWTNQNKICDPGKALLCRVYASVLQF